MAIINWKEAYNTGIPVFDQEHHQLVEQTNRLYEALREKKGEEVLEDILRVLESYTGSHFNHEEKLMTEYQFPGLEEHLAQHQALISAIAEIKERLAEDRNALAAELFKLLRHWLLDHIVEVDKKYGPFLQEKGGSDLT